MTQPKIGDQVSEKQLKAEGFEEYKIGEYLRRAWVRGGDLCYLMCGGSNSYHYAGKG